MPETNSPLSFDEFMKLPTNLGLTDIEIGKKWNAIQQRVADPNRGQVLPFKEDEEGNASWAFPQWALDAYNSLTLPRDIAMSNYVPTEEDIINFAGMVGLGGVGGSEAGLVPEGALGTFSGGKRTHSTPMYDPKPTVEDAITPDADVDKFQGIAATPAQDMAHGDNLIYHAGDGELLYGGWLNDENVDSDWQNEDAIILGGGDFGPEWEEGTDLAHQQIGDYNQRNNFDPYGWQSVDTSVNDIMWTSPLTGALSDLDLPAKGKSIMKDITQLAPDVRKAEVDAFGLNLDPEKVYTKEDISKLIKDNLSITQAHPGDQGSAFYHGYQRQDKVGLQDPEIDYSEIPVTSKRMDQNGFQANSQHFGEDTIAHTRLSLRDGAEGPYTLVEELQSDLLQKGWKKREDPANLNNSVRDAERVFADYDLPYMIDKLVQTHDVLKNGGHSQMVRESLNLWKGYLHNSLQKMVDEGDRPGENFTYMGIPGSPDMWKAKQEALRASYPEEYLNEIKTSAEDHAEGIYEKIPNKLGDLPKPPISNTTDGVRIGIQAAIAYAQQKGTTKVVIPPFQRIVEARDFNSPEIKQNMLKENSPFFGTYVNSVNKVLMQMKKELGDKISIKPVEMNYRDVESKSVRDNIEFANDVHGEQAVLAAMHEDAIGFRRWWHNYFGQHFTDDMIETARTEIFRDLEGEPINNNLSKLGLEIDISGMQDLDLNRPRFAEGGTVVNTTDRTPPPGATAKEVADDVPIMASEGEYVIPANVVRYIGLKTIEKMVDDAKEALGELHKKGRVGGEPAPAEEEDDELPFDMAELMSEDDGVEESVQHLAEGGLVTNPVVDDSGYVTKAFKDSNGNTTYIPFLDGEPLFPIPAGYSESTEAPTDSNKPKPNATTKINPIEGGAMSDRSDAKENGAFVEANKSALAGNPNDWTPTDFINFGNQRNGAGEAVMKGVMSMVPLGKLAVGARDKYLDRSASKLLDDMIEKGVDLQGNPIAPDQMAMLSKTRSDMIDSMNEKSGLSLNPLGKLQDMLHTFTSLSTGTGGQGGKPMSSVSPEAEAMLNANSSGSNGSSSDDQYSGGSYGVGSDLGRDPSQGPSSGQMASGGLYNRGGLIARRK